MENGFFLTFNSETSSSFDVTVSGKFYDTNGSIISEREYTVPILGVVKEQCFQYLKVPDELIPSLISFELGSVTSEIDITPSFLSDSYTERDIPSECGNLQVSLLDIDSTIATVTLATDPVKQTITGSRLQVNPSAVKADQGIYPVRLVWSLQQYSVEASLQILFNEILNQKELEFIPQSSCLDAYISFQGKDSFPSEYNIYAGDWF